MKRIYLLMLFLFPLIALAQSFPVAVDDTAQVMNQKLVEIYPLLNDYDLDGDTIEILKLYSGNHGDAWYEDSIVYFKSEWFEGWEDLRYKVAKVGSPGYQSDFAYIQIEVIPNPDIPVAVRDTFQAKYLEPVELDILANDYDLNGDVFKINSIHYTAYGEVEISPDSMSVLFTSDYAANGYAYFRYTIMEANTPDNYYSDEVMVLVFLEENEDLPIAYEDNCEVTGGITTAIDVLENDFNPLNDTLEIFSASNPSHGSLFIENNLIYYTSGISYAGKDEFKYNIRYKDQPHLYAQKADVKIDITKNPNCPLGEPDYGSGIAYTDISVEVLSNDNDPLGDEIEIMDVKSNWNLPGGSTISFSGNTVTYKPPAFVIGSDTAYYRIRKKVDTLYYSQWIPIIFDVSHNPAYPLTFPDYASTKAGMAITINFIKNDIIQDSIEITNISFQGGKKGLRTDMTDSTVTYTPYSNTRGLDSMTYRLSNFGHPPYFYAIGKIFIDIEGNFSYDSLTINNINAGFNASGIQFTRIDEIPDYNYGNFTPHFEAPKGSGKHAIFCNTIWIGGRDNEGMLFLAGERYRNYGEDYQPGPVANIYDSAFYYHWNTMWKLNKTEVEYHRNNWWKEGYEPIRSIAEWPGNGDQSYGMAEQLAPYFDYDGNTFYDPMAGDYPLIRGDQCIFFITNDDKYHSNTQSASLKVEIQGMAYAFDAPTDSILNNTIFVHYSLINRSERTYYDTYYGVFSDLDLGFAWDDRLGSTVIGGSYYVYNGEDTDGNGEPGTYGEYPPALSISFLAGPFIDPDQEDNPNGGCDFSVNGLNFGNGIPDDERYGMTRYTQMIGGGSQSEPINGGQYYQYLQGLWLDNVPVSFGGAGHPQSGAVGPDCRFMFPGKSDPMNWGTDCTLPNEGYNQNGKYWTEEEEGFNPNDRSGLGVSGPFTFHPGDVQEVDMAYMFANSYHSADSSKELLISRLLELRQRVLNGEIIIPNDELDVKENTTQGSEIRIYPNPAGDVIFVSGLFSDKAEYRISNVLGTTVQQGSVSSEINISGLKPGVFILAVLSDKKFASVKFIKL